MVSRFAARLLTGPLAFLVAGAIDVGLLWGRYFAHRARARARGLREPAGG